jgi:uncharacterized protein YndB with AHSA1/START domain
MTIPTRGTTAGRTRIQTSIEVPVPPERAFEVFTSGIDSWWKRDSHILGGGLRQVAIEPGIGGRVWEENDAGEICVWGHVSTWDPPSVFACSWLLGPDWSVPAPDAPSSRVTVTFTQTNTGTHVELVHDQLDRHGPGWESLRDAVGDEGGWPDYLCRMAEVVINPG